MTKTLECFKDGKRWLTLVFASILLASLGILIQNVFADQVVSTIPVSGALGVAANPNTNKVYVANGNGYYIQVIDGVTNTVTATIQTASPAASPNSGGCHTDYVDVNPTTNLIYTSNGGCQIEAGPVNVPHSVSVINGTTNDVITTVNLPNSRPTIAGPLIVNSVTNKIYVFSFENGGTYINVIDGKTNQVTAQVPTFDSTASYGPFDLAVNSQTNMIYVLTGSEIFVINGTSDSVVSSFTWGKAGDNGLGVNPTTNQIYISNSDNSVSVIDGATYQVITTIPSTTYGFVTVNPVTDKIYVSDAGGGNYTAVLDGKTNTLLTQVQVGQKPYGIGINTNTNKIYVGNSGDATVSVIDDISSASVPSSPQNLQANAGNSQITLSWSTPSSNGGSAITGYNVYRGTTSGSEGSTPIATGITSTSYNDTTVTNSQEYFYTVTAVNSVGASSPSNEASATPTAPATVPSEPTGLAATAISSSQINLSWTAPSSNGGSQITGYMIERSNNTGTTWSTISANTGSTNIAYNDTGLAASTTYTYRVSAINSAGTSSPSNTASATTQAATAPPPAGITLDNVQSTSGTVSSSNQITLANFNVGTGTNKLLVVGVSANNNDVSSITFGGVPLAKKVESFTNNDAEFWYLKNPSGTGNIVVTMSGSTSAVVGAYSFSGVNQTTPLPTSITKHNTNPNSPNISITTKFSNSWVLDLPSIYGGSTLGSPTCIQQWNDNVPGAITGASSSTVVSSPGAVACKWTASSADLWDDAAVEIKAAG